MVATIVSVLAMAKVNIGRWVCALHEAGHAIAALGLGVPVYSIEVHDDGTGALCRKPPTASPINGDEARKERYALCKLAKMLGTVGEPSWLRTELVVLLAGPAVTHNLRGDLSGSAIDLDDVFHLVSGTLPSNEQSNVLTDVIDRAVNLVDRYWREVEHLGSTLYASGKLLAPEIKELLRHKSINECVTSAIGITQYPLFSNAVRRELTARGLVPLPYIAQVRQAHIEAD